MRSSERCRSWIRQAQRSNLRQLRCIYVAYLDADTDTLQGGWVGREDKLGRSTHPIAYIRQMLEWGFDKEFIARDMGVNLASLEIRLNRAKKREQQNESTDEDRLR